MKKRQNNKPTIEEIAEMAERGEDVNQFFTNEFKVRRPIQRVNVDFTDDFLKELDQLARDLNVSRQAVIKTFLRQAIDNHYLAKKKAG